MVDSSTRRAALIAALVAVPVAVLVAVFSFRTLAGHDDGGGAAPASPSAAPQPSSTVSVPAPPLTERQTTVCRALVSQLPGTLRDRPQRPVSAGSEQNAAYGDPPIVVSCGAPVASPGQDAQLILLDGVCWYPEETSNGSVWTALDREVPVSVTVPKQYESPGQWVIGLSPAVAGSVPSVPTVRFGCR